MLPYQPVVDRMLALQREVALSLNGGLGYLAREGWEGCMQKQ